MERASWKKDTNMNQYTPDQLRELFDIIKNIGAYPSSAVKAFMSDETNLAINSIVLCKDSASVYKNLSYFKKGAGIHIEEHNKRRKVRDFIFDVEKDNIPLYINDKLLHPILIWRLQKSL